MRTLMVGLVAVMLSACASMETALDKQTGPSQNGRC